MKKTEKMIHQNIRFRSRIDTFLVSIEEFPSPSGYHGYWKGGSAIQGISDGILYIVYLVLLGLLLDPPHL